jgi:hypothetical protein
MDPKAVPSLYSRTFILAYTLFLTPIGGTVLLAMNLINIDRSKHVLWLMLGLVVFEIGHLAVMQQGQGFWFFLGPNVVAGLLLAFPVWNLLFKDVFIYERRSIGTPLIILAIVWIAILVIGYRYQG